MKLVRLRLKSFRSFGPAATVIDLPDKEKDADAFKFVREAVQGHRKVNLSAIDLCDLSA